MSVGLGVFGGPHTHAGQGKGRGRLCGQGGDVMQCKVRMVQGGDRGVAEQWCKRLRGRECGMCCAGCVLGNWLQAAAAARSTPPEVQPQHIFDSTYLTARQATRASDRRDAAARTHPITHLSQPILGPRHQRCRPGPPSWPPRCAGRPPAAVQSGRRRRGPQRPKRRCGPCGERQS